MTALSGNDEISFRMSAPRSFVDVLRSFIDEDSVIKFLLLRFSTLLSRSLHVSMDFNTPTIRTTDVAINTFFGDGW